jgi:predicted nucleotidyltransferase component of viral defense system
MTLHNNADDFSALITFTANHFNRSIEFVEKDYWITLTLNLLARSANVENVVFKGGTSLSKGYQLINRFSEDIDIAMINENLSGNALKTKIRNVEKDISIGLTEHKEPEITSKGSMFRKSVFQYPSILNSRLSGNVPKRIIIEINSFANPYPYVKREITSFIADFLSETNRKDIIEQYNLQPFILNVLDKRRTMIEKLVSLVRFSFSENPVQAISSKIRHFYDLYFLANNYECSEYLNTLDFKKDFEELYAHDQEMFAEPENWVGKTIEQSPLITNFPSLWAKLKDSYNTELSQLAFSQIPEEKEVAQYFIEVMKSMQR